MAREGAIVGPVVCRPAAVLAAVHRLGRCPSRAQARAIGFEITPAPDQERDAPCRGRLHHPGWRRAGRPRATDAACNARAAVGRRHPDRRSGRPGSCRLRSPRGPEAAARQHRRFAPGRPRYQLDDGHARPVREARGMAQARRPHAFGRPGREVAVWRAAGIDVELVPGIAADASRAGSVLLERFLSLAADRRQRNQEAERERGDQQAEADRPL